MLKHPKEIAAMTLREKANATLMHDSRCFIVERLGQNGFKICDNPRGDIDDKPVAQEDRQEGEYYPVSFPQAAALAATWDEDAVAQVGAAMGNACKFNGIDVLLRPGVNIKRSPLCGRNFEYYSEDPVVSGKLGAAYIRGIQSEGTGACLKHYAVNNQEFERMTTNAVVSGRALREIYLKAFGIAVREAQPWTVMTSYNKVNGQWVPANPELMSILRDEFQFDGVVISDAMAIHTEKVDSHRYGLDFEIAGRGLHANELQNAINSGDLPEETLDLSIDRMLTLMDKLKDNKPTHLEDIAENRKLARKIAAQSVVLLENDGILPLKKRKQTVAVIGALAKTPNTMGGGSGHMNGHTVDITLDEIKRYAGENTLWAAGYNLAGLPKDEQAIDPALVAEAAKTAAAADVTIFLTGLPKGYESEGYDRHTLALPGDQLAALEAVLKASDNVVVVNASGSAVDLTPAAHKARAVVHTYLSGETMGGALVDVLYGVEDPQGRLPETFPLRLQDTPAYLSFPQYPEVMRSVRYSEDVFVGYRWYEKRDIPVLYPFGHGLSYTTFDYGELTAVENAGNADVSIKVSNTGKRAAAQTLQLYVKPVSPSTVRPVKELAAFGKVWLAPGETKTVAFTLDRSAFSYYDEERGTWIAENGRYELVCGISAVHQVAAAQWTITDGDKPMLYNNLTPVDWAMKDPRTPALAAKYPEALQKVLMPDDALMGALMGAVPMYRFGENTLFGDNRISADDLAKLMDEYNNSGK